MRALRLVAIVAVALFASIAPALAEDPFITDQPGSYAGVYLETYCPENWVVNGVQYHSGKALDHVRAHCTKVQKDGQMSGAAFAKKGFGGGGGDARGNYMCPPQQAVTSMRVWVDGNGAVFRFRFTCATLDGKHTTKMDSTVTAGGEAAFDHDVKCGKGWLAIGLAGQSGDLVDGLGLICSRNVVLRGLPQPEPQQTDPQPLAPVEEQAPVDPGPPPPPPVQVIGGPGSNQATVVNRTLVMRDNNPNAEVVGPLIPGVVVTYIDCAIGWCQVTSPLVGFIYELDLQR
jgi:hypothetical protein